MRIATLQMASRLGEVERNMQKADQLIEGANPVQLDLLVLPEMVFSGYNFLSLEAITPFLEPSNAGPSTDWAKRTARRLQCVVAVGYPEITASDPPQRYNSVVSVSPTGEVLATYRKTFLYYTDDTWASEGDAGFFHGALGSVGQACMGICMDINPRKFVAPWTAYEFATHCVGADAPLVVLSMAWLTRLLPRELQDRALQPDLETLTYWIERFRPIMGSKREGGVVLVLANRCGNEPGTVVPGADQEGTDDGEQVVSYAGSSCVLRIQDGAVQLFDILGRAEETLLIADTDEPPRFALQAKTET
ncbi:hypothetical protein MBLNU459_g5387t1 [Dothideomycetes sp. NU459]